MSTTLCLDLSPQSLFFRSQGLPCEIYGAQNSTGTGFSPSTAVFLCRQHSTISLYCISLTLCNLISLQLRQIIHFENYTASRSRERGLENSSDFQTGSIVCPRTSNFSRYAWFRASATK